MGIFGALTTAVPGMRAQAYALENISGNIANSQTTAFKRIDTSFVDLIPDGQPSKQLAGNVTANSRSTNVVKSATANLADASGDAGLDAVLSEIELRVEVEIAKMSPPRETAGSGANP